MKGYKIVQLKHLIESLGDEKVCGILSEFKCPKNPDVEKFLTDPNKAMNSTKQGKSRTFLVLRSHKNKPVIVGYFSLTTKTTTFKRNFLKGKLKSRMIRFATLDTINNRYEISLPLIGQFGKNFNNGYDSLIEGDVLLKFACDKIKVVHHILGGNFAFVYLECEDVSELKDFYERNGFVYFNKRCLERDEKRDLKGDYLLQMIKDLSERKNVT
ncbi:MAG: N-acetyltransferase [Clostridiales bacterium]|jgi:hypothetical protein|nr:N-acetyltransferase [Clostridiales bacterium]